MIMRGFKVTVTNRVVARGDKSKTFSHDRKQTDSCERRTPVNTGLVWPTGDRISGRKNRQLMDAPLINLVFLTELVRRFPILARLLMLLVCEKL